VKPERHWQYGDLFVACLEQIGVEYVFGIPGGAIEPLFNALARSERRGGPRIVVSRHEVASAFAAEAYGEETGRLGVCCATTGPGATNLITGVANAYKENRPLLVITAQTALHTHGMGGFQESSDTGVDIVQMLSHCTHFSSQVSHPAQLEKKLAMALDTAFGSPGGPVHLSIPADVLRTECLQNRPSFDFKRLIDERLHRQTMVDDDAFKELCRRLSTEEKFVFVLGDHAGRAIGDILECAFLTNASVVTTPQGKGLISPYHPLYRGVTGFAGHESARELLKDHDVRYIVAIGTDHTEWATDGWDEHGLLGDQLIHVESDDRRLARSPMAVLRVRGSIKTIFAELVHYLRSSRSRRTAFDPSRLRSLGDRIGPNTPMRLHFQVDDEKAYHSVATPIKPQRLMWDLPRLLPPDAVYLADSGASFAWSIHYLHPFDRRIGGSGTPRAQRAGLFRTRIEWGSMGWAIGAAIGVALGRPHKPVVAITGDGSFLMSGQEFTVAVQERLPVIFVVLNDSALGMVKHGQRMAGSEQYGTAMPPVRFDAMARAMGGEDAGYAIHSPLDLQHLDWQSIARKPGPTLLDVRIDPEEVPPIATRVKVLASLAD
jgi:acetolactate synthase-1/2/3 large subunit